MFDTRYKINRLSSDMDVIHRAFGSRGRKERWQLTANRGRQGCDEELDEAKLFLFPGWGGVIWKRNRKVAGRLPVL